MDQSTSLNQTPRLHVAIVMDGNGRWALRRERPRTAGHLMGARAVRRTVEAAARRGIGTLTLFAFSGDNWRRPAAEVDALMRLFRRYLASETARCIETGVRVVVIGRRDRLPAALTRAIEATEAATAAGSVMLLRIALDYSARDSILRAAAALAREAGPPTRERLAALIGAAEHQSQPTPDVDLLVRTGGERRLSDFLLWECAYAELHFTSRLWPDFTDADLAESLRDYASRERRFGGISQASGQ